MKFEDFQAGSWSQQLQYKSFVPNLVNVEWSWEDARINVLLEDATRALGELNAYTRIVPDVDLFIQMHIRKEANTSSRIEGTNTDIEEDVLSEEEVPPEKRDDWQEVQNYVRAMNNAVDSLKALLDTAKNGTDTFEKILVLRQELEAAIFKMGRRAQKARNLLQYLYATPVVSISDTEKILNINNNPARELISAMEKLGILEEITGYKRNRLFAFRKYLTIFADHSRQPKRVIQ